MLTEEKVTNGFRAAGERMDSIETEAKSAFQDLKASLDAFAKQLKLIRFTGRNETGQPRNRFWGSDEEAKAFGELFFAAANRKAMGEGVNADGGYLVPEELRARIIDKMGVYGKFRKNAMVLPLGTDRCNVPKVEADLLVYAPGEGKEIDASDMEFSQVGLTMRKLACLAKVSSELEEDSVIAIGEILGISIARSMAKKEDQIGFLGDGTDDYFGMTGIVGALRAVDADPVNIPGIVTGSGNVYSEFTLNDFQEVVGRLPEDADEFAKWFMSKRFYYKVVYPLARTAGVANIFEILSDRKSQYLMSYPVEFVSCMPHVEANDQICAILGDLSIGAFLGERKALTIARSTDVYFANDQIGFRGLERIDVNAFGVGDTEDAGPIVALRTAAG